MRHADGRTEALTGLEQRLLAYFVKNAGRIISRQELLREVWGVPDRVPTRTLDIAVSRLRVKIEPDAANPLYLVTHRGLGYRYEARRGRPAAVHGRIPTQAGWVDLHKRTVRTLGEESTLGDREAELLRLLLEHPGEPVPVQSLLRSLWGRGLDTGRVRTALSRLRHKVEQDPSHPRHLLTTDDGVLFAPLEAPTSPHRSNVPAPQGLFVGRVDSLRRTTSELRAGRAVLVRGLPGIGKSRFLVELAAREAVAQQVWPGGVWMVSLAGVAHLEEIGSRLALALGLSLSGTSGPSGLPSLIEAIRGWGRSLLLLDDADGVGPEVFRLLARLEADVPGVGLVAASRGRLGSRGAGEVVLGPLASAEAERVFAGRMGRRAAGEGAPVLSRLVGRLDGNPLALELAAGQATAVGDRRLLETLEWGRPLAGAAPSSLDAALNASWALLAPGTSRLLRALSVWCGEIGLAEAQAVGDPGLFVPGLLQSLCASGLLRSCSSSGSKRPQRYELPVAVRESALRRLVRAGEEEATRSRQQGWLVKRVEVLARELDGMHPDEAMEGLESLREDVRATSRRLRRSAPSLAARLHLGLWRATQWTRPSQEVFELLDQAEAWAEASGDQALHARAVLLRARAGRASLAPAEFLQRAARGRDRARGSRDPGLEAFGHLLMGQALLRQGRLEASETTLQRACTLLEARQEPELHARVWMAIGATARRRAGVGAALAAYRQAVVVAQIGGCRAALVRSHLHLGVELLATRNWKEATRELVDGLDAASELPWPLERARILSMLAHAALEEGALDRAEAWCEEGLELERRRFPSHGPSSIHRTLALLRVEQGRGREAEEEGVKMQERWEHGRAEGASRSSFLRGLARLVGARPGAAALFEQAAQAAVSAPATETQEVWLCLAAARALEGRRSEAVDALDQASALLLAHADLRGQEANLRLAGAIVRQDASPDLRRWAASMSPGELGFLGRMLRSLLP